MPTTPRPTGISESSSSADRREALEWFGVPGGALAAWWPSARPFIEAALAEGPGDMTAEDVHRFLRSGHMQLWLLRARGVRGALVTEIAVYPRQKTCIARLFSAESGRSFAWLPMMRILEAWAREQECCAVEVIGRAGWKRILPEYRQTHVVLRKELA